MEIFGFFNGMNWWTIPIVLGLFTAGLIAPLRTILIFTGYTRRFRARYYVLFNPVVEELIFRLGVLSIAMATFGVVTGIVIMAVCYMIYMGLIYGPPYVADALILSVLLSLAMFEFGFVTVLLAHIFYRIVFVAW